MLQDTICMVVIHHRMVKDTKYCDIMGWLLSCYEPKGRGFESLLARQRQAAAPTSRSSLLWWSRFLLPAFFIDVYFITLTHVAANPCGSSHFSAQNAASPYGLPLLSAKSHARLGCSVASALAYASLSLPTFRG